ncbi:hypothetical protein Taro_007948 [Colocasia esculenta]|uniref:Uncharacterized protein n=1 Tax=Colocasia esculenta TaxID=4460 RepID=A0A843TWY7_COLES|nr:hypothetical protein [Colocasia esculenta]
MSFRGRKTFVSHSKIVIPDDDLPVSKPTISLFPRFSGNNVSLDFVNPWRGNHTELACHGDRKLCSTRPENCSPGCKYGCTNIADIIQRFSVRHPNFPLGAWSRAAVAIAYGHPFAQMGITFRSVIGIAYKTLMQNWHSEALVAPYCLSKMRIFVRAAIGTTREAPIRNRHFDLVGTGSDS